MRNVLLAAIAALGLLMSVLSPAGEGWAQTSDRASINDEEYATLVFDLISVLPNTFAVQGTNPSGSTYRGSAYLNFDAQSGDLLIDWQVGNDSYSGRGPLIGGEFIVDWGDSSPVIYTVQRDGSLFGTWGNGRGTEVLTFAP
ncbi:MAG: hypothetical protein AAF590_11215 [Pseudomonadota bacterium]